MPDGEADSPDALRPRQETLSGIVLRRIFPLSRESGFCVLSVRVPGESEPVKLVGTTTGMDHGDSIQAEGSWVWHEEYGRQFEASKIISVVLTNLDWIESYLASGAVDGIGPEAAKTIVEAFEEETFNTLSCNPEQLQKLDGIDDECKAMILESWEERQNLCDVELVLHKSGASLVQVANIYKHYGDKMKAVIEQNCYRLMKVHGIDFLMANRIALSLGTFRHAPERLRAGIPYAVRTAVGEKGHCAMPLEELAERTAELLECEIEEAESAISCEIKTGGGLVLDQIGGEDFVFPRALHDAESSIAVNLRRLFRGQVPWPDTNAAPKIKWVEGQARINLGTEQRDALLAMLATKLMLLTGGPGVGKTAIINALLRLLDVQKKTNGQKVVVRLCAPTGRAARVLGDATNTKATTINALLDFDLRKRRFRHNQKNPLDCDLVVVDETSMVDTELMAHLLEAVPDRSALLLIGDPNQLPSVGPGRVLAELIEFGTIRVVHLSEVFRQPHGSRIPEIADRINRGEAVDLDSLPERDGEFRFVPTQDTADLEDKVVNLVQKIVKQLGLDSPQDVQVLSPMYKNDAGVESLNRRLQQALNEGAGQSSGTQRLWPGDRVMQTCNDYDRDVLNGDIGYVEARLAADDSRLRVCFGDRPVEYEEGDADALSLAYAATVHKAQGSGYPAVVIVLHKGHSIMLKRNLLYTAVTRGKKLVVLVGEKRAVQMAINNTEGETRHTKLREWLDRQDFGSAQA